MARDPYTVLGVARDANAETIRKAYRDLVKRYHPDKNPDDPKAEERFKEIGLAWDILGDADKRKRFDRGEIDASGAETPSFRGGGFGGGFHGSGAGGFGQGGAGTAGSAEDISDIFAELFGQRRGGGRSGFSARGRDSRYELTVAFAEAALGAKKRVTMPDGKTLDIAIPEGVKDGQTLRLKGKGQRGVGDGPPGDALITVTVAPDPRFERRGDDIYCDLPVSLDEAVLGAKVSVPTLTGPVSLTIPPGSNSGRVLRLRGKGIKGGHQMVRLVVTLPDTPDDELKQFLEGWRQRHGYNPRD